MCSHVGGRAAFTRASGLLRTFVGFDVVLSLTPCGQALDLASTIRNAAPLLTADHKSLTAASALKSPYVMFINFFRGKTRPSWLRVAELCNNLQTARSVQHVGLQHV